MSTNHTADNSKPKKRGKLKMVFYIIVALVTGLAALMLFGPRATFNDQIRFDANAIGDDLDAYLAKSENAVPDLRDYAAKEIIWAYPQSKAKTPVSLVYIHGFSASKGELRPVPDMAAATLKANLFYTRLEGHGAGAQAMGNATGQDWLDDVAEAVEIGSRIGEKTVMIGTSTGATLASIAVLHPELKDKIAAVILISPNFKVKATGSGLLTLPYADIWLPLIAGSERSFEPANAAMKNSGHQHIRQRHYCRWARSSLMPRHCAMSASGNPHFSFFLTKIKSSTMRSPDRLWTGGVLKPHFIQCPAQKIKTII